MPGSSGPVVAGRRLPRNDDSSRVEWKGRSDRAAGFAWAAATEAEVAAAASSRARMRILNGGYPAQAFRRRSP
jgi:hypothetical protein